MPKHYSNNNNDNTHTMPDGTKMTGKTHSKSSKPVNKKEDDDFIDELKEGALKKMLKIKKDDAPLKIGELQKLLKEKEGEPFTFRGKEIKKMTPLMRKRINTAITLIRISKKK